MRPALKTSRGTVEAVVEGATFTEGEEMNEKLEGAYVEVEEVGNC